MIPGVFNYGSMPVLERLVQFTGARHNVIADNIANLSTPYHRPRDLSVDRFQKTLRKAVDQRRRTDTPVDGELPLKSTREFRFSKHGTEFAPEYLNENVMFHDRNNRDLERIMQDLAENTLAHNAGLQLLKGEFDLLKMAIAERV